jgi:predicted dehydrogenase
MKVLFAGLGSIGQRHLHNLRDALGDSVEIIAWRRIKHQNIINDCKVSKGSLESLYHVIGYDNLDEALALSPQIAFITNPSALHVSTALRAAVAGCDLFIEKPLSHNLRGIAKLKKVCEDKKNVVMMGYQNRYHPLCNWLAELVAARKKTGRVVSASFEWGAWMPGFHPYEDYKQTYAARRDMGGGAILCLIHELDLILRLFGAPENVKAFGGKLSSLDIDTDDTVMALLKYPDCVISLFLSFAQTHETRRYRIQFERATLLIDLVAGIGELHGLNGRVIARRDCSNLERNALFIEEMKTLLKCVKERCQPECGLAAGIESLQLAQRIQRQLQRKIHA